MLEGWSIKTLWELTHQSSRLAFFRIQIPALCFSLQLMRTRQMLVQKFKYGFTLLYYAFLKVIPAQTDPPRTRLEGSLDNTAVEGPDTERPCFEWIALVRRLCQGTSWPGATKVVEETSYSTSQSSPPAHNATFPFLEWDQPTQRSRSQKISQQFQSWGC